MKPFKAVLDLAFLMNERLTLGPLSTFLFLYYKLIPQITNSLQQLHCALQMEKIPLKAFRQDWALKV